MKKYPSDLGNYIFQIHDDSCSREKEQEKVGWEFMIFQDLPQKFCSLPNIRSTSDMSLETCLEGSVPALSLSFQSTGTFWWLTWQLCLRSFPGVTTNWEQPNQGCGWVLFNLQNGMGASLACRELLLGIFKLQWNVFRQTSNIFTFHFTPVMQFMTVDDLVQRSGVVMSLALCFCLPRRPGVEQWEDDPVGGVHRP